ncbi:MAG TPA: periplasmic heavy metal sensor [Candidatus Binatia bacterium]|nr:periplasmic heavy metal sensor [Candidatus Binatia bacterium]
MMRRSLLGFLLLLVFMAVPGWAAAIERAKPPINEEFAQGLDDLGRELREWFGRWGEYFGSGATKNEERPLIAFMLRNREKLGLSAAQVKSLEQLRNDFQKESIRKDADLRVAEMDLNGLLGAEKIDMPKVEAKVREIERLRTDLRLSRIRTIQKGKEVLSADQRKKLHELLTEQQSAGL